MATRRGVETIASVATTSTEKATIEDALRMKARAIRHEAMATAKAVGNWEHPGVQELVDEAQAVDALAERFA